MWNKKFVYVLNYLKTFKAVHKNNPRMRSPQQDKKCRADDSCPLQSLYSRKDSNHASFIFFYQKGCFWYKTEKVNITIEFCIFELIQVANFSLNWQFWFVGPNLPKKGNSRQKQKKKKKKKRISHWVLNIENSLSTKF